MAVFKTNLCQDKVFCWQSYVLETYFSGENKLEKEALKMKFRGEIYDQRLASKMALLLRDELL